MNQETIETDFQLPQDEQQESSGSQFDRRWRLALVIVGIGLLLVLVLLIYLSFPGVGSRYMSEASPEAAAFNYSLALINEDYSRAWSQLSTSLREFPETPDILRNQLYLENEQFNLDANPCVYIESVLSSGSRATVRLREQYYDPCGVVGLQNLTYTYFEVKLLLEAGEWRIVDADRHFVPAWHNP